ncbi:MAG: threonine synthase [Candidatus Rokubacteria bacterium]|nr:threonine synthase [Candidatus Rokubacteria bacterium]
MAGGHGLKCGECGRAYPAGPIHVCELCFGPLEVEYDYAALAGRVTRAAIAAGPRSMWRYKDLLPVSGEPGVGEHVGLTPLVRADNLAAELGVREIWIKNDGVCHPTWSFKDRVVSVAVAKAREFGFDTIACASTGNLANSVAAHAAEARLASYVFVPVGLEEGKVLTTLVYGPTLVAVEGTYDDVNRLCSEIADQYRWAFVNVNVRAYYGEGSKTVGYEIVEQLGWKTPGHVVVPCAGGSLMTKIWKAIQEFQMLGLIDGPVRTRVHAAQPAGCGPIVTMIKHDTDVLVPVRPDTIAKSLAMGNPGDAVYAYRTAKETGGAGEHATDEEIVDGMRLLARTEGIFAETAGGVTVAATRKLVEAGVIPRDESIVICVTGAGLKTPDALRDRLAADVTIRPSLAAFDRALAELEERVSTAP